MATFKVRDQEHFQGSDQHRGASADGRGGGMLQVKGRRTVSGDPAKTTLKDLLPSGAKADKFRIRMGGSVEFSPQDFGKTIEEVNPKGEDFVFEVEPNYVNPYAEVWDDAEARRPRQRARPKKAAAEVGG